MASEPKPERTPRSTSLKRTNKADGLWEIHDPKTGKVVKIDPAELAAQVRTQGESKSISGKSKAEREAQKKIVADAMGFRSISGKRDAGMDLDIKKYTPKGRTLRKEFQRPRPDLPAYADENRTRKPISITLPPDLLQQVNERCRELDVDRTAFIEAAVRRAMKPS